MRIKVKNTIKMIIDIIMLLIMISLMNKDFTGMKAHEIFGIILFILFFIHKIINIKTIKVFCKNLFNKKFKVKNKVSFILDILLLFFIIGIITTGILISNYLFKDIFIGNRGIIKKIHIFLSWWSLLLVSIHIGFHLKTIIICLKSKINIIKNKKTVQTIVILLFVLCSVFGLFFLSKENIYKKIIPNFSVNYFSQNQNNKNDDLHKTFDRKYKNRINKNSNLDNQIHFNNINIYEISSIMILFAGGTYLTLNTIEKKKNK